MDTSPSPRVITVLEPTIEKKGWGHEEVIINCPDYCAKLLRFNPRTLGSLHFHMNKHETWRVLEGSMMLHGREQDTGYKYNFIVKKGDIVDIPRGVVHQVEALEGVLIMEVSTPHRDDDTYRVAPGDSQMEGKS